MHRRRFLSLLGLGVAGIALEQAIPLGRVWSFPSQIVVPELSLHGLPYNDDYIGTTGTWMNLERYPFPGKLKTPYARDPVRYS